ncbi:peroxiredoxin-like family protein [Flavobacterium capsici]|uniref:thioredoxin-dependent peroxiredoxin n=1 Tax=Flavobacterium capsici TaxID=3075618 RepID=A0AA96EZE3_9FLAO|nr:MULTISPECIES: peroxiredoxin-like family protein [unclassified Flavobacterium]WNM20078.1 peroxiredoxin-like family protein [Flavobacterium sp. PMR2A8]WNM21467.1 peroxiredoxin-like family protein [Flavobacterium sp. PMTSA4]
MKKIIILFAIVLAQFSVAQNDLPKSANDIAPLLIGEKAPNTNLTSIDGKPVSFLDVLNNNKTILVFYRGGWCPYCNKHLSALAEAEPELLKMGYKIVAVSPDSAKSLEETKSKDKVNYTLLSDSENNFSKAFGLAFEAPKNYEKYLMKGSDNVNSSIIPVPSVFILDKDGTILFEYIAPDYKHRLSNELLLSVANSLK